ncbi:phosphatase PAP2 family protein [Microcoleus sp. FACHB-SPT15]|uniref:phosphatase PAP2 family protein n=1 Tax=Microcoleus sp. FACHB-SPT15 TaxID=2692830 RepID=UPI001784B851|nr:phosphatase PAP2 family protein [Microcoleus sp. FACHB-SPT15]MBD1807722.1 phosphatase PAP2 family protein [Microcoleus sp. FACHB-SPT15]
MPKLSRELILALPSRVREHLLPLLLTIRVAGFLLAALGLWLFSAIADEILDKESFTFDKEILLTLRELHTPVLDKVMLGFTFLGEPVILLIVCLVIGTWLLTRGQRSQATILIIAASGAVALNTLLKVLFGRARPMLWERVVDVGQYSFPSGHAMISMVIFGIIGYLVSSKFPLWRIGIISLTILLVTGIGLSRLYLGVHWPTDIIAGYAAGLVWLITCIFSLQVWQERRAVAQKPESETLSDG